MLKTSNQKNLSDALASQLRQEYQDAQNLHNAQPAIVQRFLQTQAAKVANALVDSSTQIHFRLPDQVVLLEGLLQPRDNAGQKTVPVPPEQREQTLGGMFDRLKRSDMRSGLQQRLLELEQLTDEGVAAGARLVRHSLVHYLVHQMLPAGRSVQYTAAEGEEIPSLPVERPGEKESAITAAGDAIAEQGRSDKKSGDLLVPFVPAARRFFLPQWVAFDESGHLLVGSQSEAESTISSMQRYLNVLHMAVSLAPYITVDTVYQQKRYGMLGQMVNQGRALARFQTQEIIDTIQSRVKNNELNRGLSVSLPYFDDQRLTMEIQLVEIIPAGRIMFVPAFVVRAVREELARVAQDTRLSPSTRKYLLENLYLLESAFDKSASLVQS